MNVIVEKEGSAVVVMNVAHFVVVDPETCLCGVCGCGQR